MSGLILIVAKHSRLTDTDLDHECASLTTSYETVNGESRTLLQKGQYWRLLGFGAVGAAKREGELADRAYWVGNIIDGDPLESSFKSLDGQFAVVRVRLACSQVAVAADPFGMYGLYSHEGPRAWYFTTSPISLARHLRSALDELGVKTFLRTGSIFGRRTLFEGVNRMMPAECRTFHRDSSNFETYWSPHPDGEIFELHFKEAVPALREMASSCLKSTLGSLAPLAADLTGGFDSRMLTSLLAHAELPFTAITDGSPDSPDAVLAREISTLKGWDWLCNPADPQADWKLQTRSAVAWGGGGLEAIQLGETLSYHATSPLAGILRLCAGAGEIARDYFWIQEMAAAGRTTKVRLDRLISLRMVGPTDLRPFSDDPTPLVWHELHDSLSERLSGFTHHLNTFQLEILYAFKCRGHYGAYLSAVAAHTSMVLPFFFRDLFVAFTSVKPRYRLQHHFQGALIQSLDKRLAQVRTTRGGPALPYNLRNIGKQMPYFASQGYNLGRRVVTKQGAKLARVATMHLPTQPGSPVHSAGSADGESGWVELITFLFGTNLDRVGSTEVGRWMNRRGLALTVLDAEAGRAISRVQLARMATVEAASRMSRGDF